MSRKKSMPTEVWQRVYDRDNGQCVRCAAPGGVVHHRQGRRKNDPHAIAGLVLLCDPCHRHVHDHPAESYANGLMVRRTGIEVPAEVPIRVGSTLLHLTTDGGAVWGRAA